MRRTDPTVFAGIDIGGSGVKAGAVDVTTGELVSERARVATPHPATPEAVAGAVETVLAELTVPTDGPIGAAFPGVVSNGVVRVAPNLGKGWPGVDVAALVATVTGRPTVVTNDADAAGTAERHFGALRDRPGVTALLTFGTGIGSAVFVDGVLVPNTELGHLEINCVVADGWASDRARKTDDLSWSEWAHRCNHYLAHLHRVLQPELLVLGGGISSKADKWLPHLSPPCEIEVATLGNNAGIVGAAASAQTSLAAT
jgi:polyphosphate glucokinase